MCKWIIGLATVGIFSLTASSAIAEGASIGRCPALPSGASTLPPARFDDGPTIAAAALVTDFDAWMSGLRALHPDMSIRTDLPEFEQEAARIRAELTKPMSRREAWEHFAKLNPYFRDGHAGIQMPGYRESLEAHIKAGGRIVPLDVRFAPDGSLRVFTVATGEAAIKPGDRVLAINGHDTAEMVAAMMLVSISDTPRAQRTWLEHRFAMLYWYLFGDTGEYDVDVQSATGCPHRIRTTGGTTLPPTLRSQNTAEDLFDYVLDGPYSYSSAIQFIVTVQDFGLAKIAGEETAALSCQTGQVKRIDLPWTRLSAATPIIAYTRPSGRGCERGVLPDVPIAINEVKPDETLNALAAWIRRHR